MGNKCETLWNTYTMYSLSIDVFHYKLNVNTLEKSQTDTLELNEMGQCEVAFDQDIAYQSYVENPHLGSFIIIDRQTNNTVGMGLIDSVVGELSWAEKHASERDKHWSRGLVSYGDRAQKNKHKPLLLVLTGSVKREIYSTVGRDIEKYLFQNLCSFEMQYFLSLVC